LYTIYTCFGGIRTVIYTDVIQAYSFLIGAIAICLFITIRMPGEFKEIIDIGMASQKFSLGNFDFSFKDNNFGITLLIGVVWFFAHFGIHQHHVSRILSAK